MNRLFTAIFLLFWMTPSFGQQGKESESFALMQNKIKGAVIRMDSIIINRERRKSCLGGTMKAVLKPQTKDITVTVYVPKLSEL